jgi:outer membrane cobalamin receptor
MKSAFAALLLICLSTCLKAQDKSSATLSSGDTSKVVGLDSISVFSRGISRNDQLISQVFQKTNPMQTYADLLQKQSGVFVRSRGNAALSTPSFKGLGTMHLPILINGVNMQSSMNGTMDLSLIDAVHFSNTQFVTPNGQMLGSPSLGDGLALESDMNDRGFEMNLSYGSLEEMGLSGRYSLHRKRIKYVLSSAYVNSQNQISLLPYDMDSILSNADFRRLGLVQNVDFKLSARSSLHSMLYYLNADRGIPSAFLENHQNRQEDENLVHVLTFKTQLSSKSSLQISNQFSNESILFVQSNNNVRTSSDVLNLNTSLGYHKQLAESTAIQINIQHQSATYLSDALENKANWDRLFGSYELIRNFNRGNIKLVQGLVNWNDRRANSACLSAKIKINDNYLFEGDLQKVYRIPVLNELYWYQPGEAMGNLALKPEEGYKVDFRLAYSHKALNLQLNPHFGFFQNWIQWSGYPEISPENIHRVNISGAVLNASYTYPVNECQLVIRLNTHYVNSTYQFDDQNDPRHHKQLLFTPRYTSNLTLSLLNGQWGIYGNLQYVGRNYVTSDNSSFIDPYYLMDLGGYYSHSKIRLGCSITNIMNTPYYTQPRTPLPGRIIKLTLNYILKTQS